MSKFTRYALDLHFKPPVTLMGKALVIMLKLHEVQNTIVTSEKQTISLLFLTVNLARYNMRPGIG